MKKIFLTLICFALAFSIQAQSNYGQAIQQGDAAFRSRQYKKAIDKYFAAEALDPSKKAVVQQKINKVFSEIEKLREIAEKERKKAQNLANGVLELLKRSLPVRVTDVYAYYKQQADTAFTKGDYDNAIGFYQGAKLLAENTAQQIQIQKQISNSEKCFELITQAGNHAFTLDFNKAVTAYKQLQNLNPNDPKAAWRIEAFSRPETLAMLQKLKLVTVEGGSFMMGSEENSDEKPVHKVILTTYQIGTYEVTNQHYAEFLNAYGSTKIKEGEYKGETMIWEYEWSVTNNNGKWQPQEGYENHPIVYVSWYGAYEFCRYYGLNLPTEAQWEFAARGDNKSKGYTYSGSNTVDEVAEYSGNNYKNTKPVGGKKANELGIYDMSGNVWEWCSDWYSSGYYAESPEKNPEGPLKGSNRVNRGGSWYSSASSCRVANRYDYYANYRYGIMGFRFALSL